MTDYSYNTSVKPVIHFRSRHETGNVFALLGMIANQMRRLGRYADFKAMRDRVFETNSYDEALWKMRELVHLVDDDGVY